MKRLLSESVRPYAGTIALAVFFMVIVAAATAASAWLMEPIIDEVFVAKDRDALVWVAGAVLATFVIKGIANYLQVTLISRVGLKIIADKQNQLYAHLSRMDLGFFHDNPTGTLISRFTVDIGMMRAVVSNALTSLGKDLFSLIFLVGLMFYQNWELAFISIFVFPLAILPIVRLGRRIRKVTVNTQIETGLFMTLLEQTFQGIRVVKSYGMEAYEQSRVGGLVETIFNLTFKAARIRAIVSPTMETLGGVAIAVVVIYGGHQVINDERTTGELFSFITALLLAYDPMKRLANLNVSIQEGLAGAARLFDLLDTEPSIQDAPDAKALENVRGKISFSNVRFSYGPDDPALHDITLEVPAGRRVALVGPSGAGKSTILNLIPRFYDINAGTVSIDDQDVRGLTMASLHTNAALVSQEITLFDDTVRANIAYGRAGATDEEIQDAARHAAADGFIRELAQGYDTQVGEQGVKLSGGQRQRLAIARAMLKNAPILLLDEATSALDTESERQVQTALNELMSGRTTLVIAHRLSTVVDADLIYVIEGGRITESGTHTDLLKKGGSYAKLYTLQFAD
ncbi:MAG: ATP-binding cassette domain-containing protein [Rhodospirillaceae bacterium]|nr:ATP-binding cassette domain-containing protein [Rhodospirillaceae bacterium]MBT4464039.1 ATP-binding cassette domain-containing protein [Rhodospirillaceae bacterium]MBT5012986.1 ATP-binding cassette domain-containing protein [Rhodospirillaceae bacterium]MBT5309928.1 ATP-binding cassette domain-containing protein [Rhodospirillaceae bacterium]MBT6406848.1 ATP-binding cassette domain-containing protein [Rhodospirillaceae bacterium]